MLNVFFEILNYPFLARALIAGIAISICAALLGVVMVLRRNSMIGDGLSHVAFGAFALATILGFAPLYFAIPISILAAFCILRFNQNSQLHGDAATALFSTSALAIGITAISLTRGTNVDINAYLFGSILSIDTIDLIISLILAFVVILFFTLCYHRIFALTFDESFAQSLGLNLKFYHNIIAIICAIVVVVGMKLLGSLLISSLIIFPCLTSLRLFKSFRQVTISAIVVSVICFCSGLTLSYLISAPTGASIVIVNLIAFLLCSICRKFVH